MQVPGPVLPLSSPLCNWRFLLSLQISASFSESVSCTSQGGLTLCLPPVTTVLKLVSTQTGHVVEIRAGTS